jgi:1-acyl-sn-glycerol-3-phosphate acyltransferase
MVNARSYSESLTVKAVLIRRFFTWYVPFLVRRNFSAFQWNPVVTDSSKSIFLLANHFSWWDGFLLFVLNRKYFRRKFCVLVSEDNFKKVGFLKYMGAFPIAAGRAGMLNGLNLAASLLADPRNLVLMFPEGELHSNHIASVEFRKGAEYIAGKAGDSFQYVFSASFIDYFEKRKPAVYCYLHRTESLQHPSPGEAYNEHYRRSLAEQRRIVK